MIGVIAKKLRDFRCQQVARKVPEILVKPLVEVNVLDSEEE